MTGRDSDLPTTDMLIDQLHPAPGGSNLLGPGGKKQIPSRPGNGGDFKKRIPSRPGNGGD